MSIKQALFIFITTLCVIAAGSLFLTEREPARSQASGSSQLIPTAAPTSPSADTQPVFQGGGVGAAAVATPTPFSANPFGYTPLPVDRGGPANDITESQPLTASRTSAQVDDFITFTAGIKNSAPYRKNILSLCFESSDGNFGCVWGITLEPGESYSLQNVGSWTTGGTKTVWITWSQDGRNYYRPKGANSVAVQIIG